MDLPQQESEPIQVESPSTPEPPSSDTKKLIIAVVITAIVVGGAAYLWQRSAIKQVEQDLASLKQLMQEQLAKPVSEIERVPSPEEMEAPSKEVIFKLKNLTECDGRAQSETAKLNELDEETIRRLGLEKFFDDGYVLKRMCHDSNTGRVPFILAKEELTKVVPDFPAMCVNFCDEVIFGIIDTGDLAQITVPSINKLGLFSESYAQNCLIDRVLVGPTLREHKLLLYCGSGESGGLRNWYHYDYKDDVLQTVQRMTSIVPEETFDVSQPTILQEFNYKSNAELKGTSS